MKNILKILIISGIFPLASCGGNDTPECTECHQLSVAGIKETRTDSSGASETVSFNNEGNSLNFILYNETADAPYNGKYQWSAAFSNGYWKMDEPVYIGQPGKMYAFSPDAEFEAPYLKVTTDRDFLVTKDATPFDRENSRLSATLSHVMAKFTVRLKGHELRSVKYTHYRSAKYNLLTGEFSSPDNMSEDVSQDGSFYVIPGFTDETVNLTLEFDEDRTYQIQVAPIKFKPGVEAILPLELNEDRIQVQPWKIVTEEYIITEEDLKYV